MQTFTVFSVTDPVYTNAENTGIDTKVKFNEFDEVLPFHATAWDTEAHGQQIYNDLKAGRYGPITPYTFDENKSAMNIRAERNMKISATDWTQGADVPDQTKQKWASYRQALRDVTSQSTFPISVTWPTPPN